MKTIKLLVLGATSIGAGAVVYEPKHDLSDLPNRMPEPAPYVVAETEAFAPPFEEFWRTHNHPGQCKSCHAEIFDQWNGSMMSNSWRDPVWRGAFLLLARAVSTHGDCDAPSPPDGSKRASHNPFARPGTCESSFDTGDGRYTVSRPGSLLDGFCSRCHMPTNYVDNVPLRSVSVDPATGIESSKVDPNFNPTSDNGTGFAFATLESQVRNTESGKAGILCAVCHTLAATRETPFHNYARTAEPHPVRADQFAVADPTVRNLGYGIGGGAYRLSPEAIGGPYRLGPLAAGAPPQPVDDNASQVFGAAVPFQHMDASKHAGFYDAMFVRAEMCATCHDVTNALPIKNELGKWVGGFPIERTYTEWAGSRYADRPGNANYDPRFKRDCQSCHMQQDYGQPGTAQTLYREGAPLPPPMAPVATDGAPRPFFTHHFVGGNALVPRLIGKDVDASGEASPYPEISVASFTSADPSSPYSRAVWTHVERRGAYAQQARLAWERLRHVLTMDLDEPRSASAGSRIPIAVTIANTGSGHDFPTGFPEGRTAWLAVHAYDLGAGRELPIHDAEWSRTSIGVGDLTTATMEDPNFPGCRWALPPGSADPYAIQFKAIASLGDGCPTLALPYASPLNLVTNGDGLPVDAAGKAIDARTNPRGIPVFADRNQDGDHFDDSFLRDTRLKPMPWPGAVRKVDRYAVVVPPDAQGPIAITTTVYYQSVEAVVAQEFLGNLTDTNGDLVLQPCVLGGPCDGRTPAVEPAVVEGAPPVPMVVRDALVPLDGHGAPPSPPRLSGYPLPGARDAYPDTVVKLFASRPVVNVDARSFTLSDDKGAPVPAHVDPIGSGAFGLFPDRIRLRAGATYTARIAKGVCDPAGSCTDEDWSWRFTVVAEGGQGAGDTSVPRGFASREGKTER
ncbi:MAG TPA: hypothetical protein VHV30_06400 [Polyangiaceae bacterium]|jgi:hypothetical protein|nr:hypothetical protein [Polyangiaceae bacterium]